MGIHAGDECEKDREKLERHSNGQGNNPEEGKKSCTVAFV